MATITGYDGDFIGFKFNGIHSKELGLVRCSNGSRYTDDITQPFSDSMIEVDGVDGAYYFGTTLKTPTKVVNAVFDNLSEVQFQRLKSVFNAKVVAQLVLDETPWKSYTVKLATNPDFQFICFGSPRVYKGELTLTFTILSVYGQAPYKFLDDYTSHPYFSYNGNDYYFSASKIAEWSDASNMKQNKSARPASGWGSWSDIDDVSGSAHAVTLWNAGYASTACKIVLPITGVSTIQLQYYDTEDHTQTVSTKVLNLGTITPINSDDGIIINSQTRLITGMKNGVETSNIYNRYITSGDFFTIPPSAGSNGYIRFKAGANIDAEGETLVTPSSITYNYLYC